jgi:hypothetical protein
MEGMEGKGNVLGTALCGPSEGGLRCRAPMRLGLSCPLIVYLDTPGP